MKICLVSTVAIVAAIAAYRGRPLIAAGEVAVTVNAAVTRQTWQGFGQAAPSTLVYPGPPTLPDSVRAIAADKAYRQAGLTMGIIGTLLESPGSYDQRRNDNSDPSVIDWNGFNADSLTATRRYVIDLARPFGFTNYFPGGETPNVRWGSPWLADIRRQDYSRFLDEAAEQVFANVVYWKNTYGEELAWYQLGNEQLSGNNASSSDGGGYGPIDPVQQMVDLTRRAGSRLRAANFRTRFVVGSEETEEISLRLATAILADPNARQYVGAIGYHTYPYDQGYSSVSFVLRTSGSGRPDGDRVAVRNRIRDLARQYGVEVWMTENSHAGDPMSFDSFRARAIQIHDEIRYADASAYFGMNALWDLASQQEHFGNRNLYTSDNEGSVVLVDNSTGKADLTNIGYAIGHYGRWIKPGAVCVESSSSDPLLQVTAFRDDAAGRLTVVLINNSAAPVAVTVSVAGAGLRGSLSGEQSTPQSYWNPVAAFAPEGSGGFRISLPATSVTSLLSGFGAVQPAARASVVSAATLQSGPIAPDSLATVFLEPGALSGPPESVVIEDARGVSRSCTLLYSSTRQANFQVPPDVGPGTATVRAIGKAGESASASVTLTPTAPGLFSAGGDGTGVAAAQIQRVRDDGTQTLDAVFQCASAGRCAAVPLDLSSAAGQAYLVLYGTGIRNRTSLAGVQASIGSTDIPVLYAGAQGASPGLDQVNLALPSMHGPGEFRVALRVDGRQANPVTIAIR